MEKSTKTNYPDGGGNRKWEWALLLVLLALILATLFHRSFIPNQIIYANDGPLGANNADSLRMPSAFVSVWRDLNFLGIYSGSFLLPVTGMLLWILKPLGFAKLYLPLVFLLLGCSAGLFFRKLKLAPAACILGAIAMSLNMEFFSTACWGIAIPATALAACFLALAVIVGDFSRISWMRLALAGLAVGVCVMEAADVGAIFSVFVAAYIAYGTLTVPGSVGKKIAIAAARVACVAVFALFMASQTVVGMIETQIHGIKAAGQDEATKQAGWEEKTRWSLPKSETVSLAVPGLFGYGIVPRDDYPEDSYWGRVGQPQEWEDYFALGGIGPRPADPTKRHTGTGFYAGIMVVLLAIWSVAQSFRKQSSVFHLDQRRAVWFWLAVFVVSLLLAFGRHAPFYRLFYSLPYASTIRNPIKFMHTVNWALVVMFAYGVHGLLTRYMKSPAKPATPKLSWWRRLDPFDRKWTLACLAILLLSAVAVGIYAGSEKELTAHLERVGFDNPDFAHAIATQSIGAALTFIPRLALVLGAIGLIMAGIFAGSRARSGAVILGVLLTVDLATADVPWIRYQNFESKYASNPIIDTIREKPFEQRVALMPPFGLTQPVPGLAQAYDLLSKLYTIEWHQILFQYFNIQSLEIVQLSRTPEEIIAYQQAMTNGPAMTNRSILPRYWQLTNCRYLFGPSIYLGPLNASFPGYSNSFRLVTTFGLTNKPGVKDIRLYEDINAIPRPDGDYALYEFTAALPRVKLYSHWEVNSNDTAVLNELGSETFDPLMTVIVSSNAPPNSAVTAARDAGTVQFASYDTKHIVFKAEAKTPAILLFNDKYDPNWRVRVDGKPAELLRCNFIMRGVYLEPGSHFVDFEFVVSNKPLYITLGAAAFGIFLLGFLAFEKRGEPSAP